MTLPLKGIKVLELARTLAGPITGQMLGDLGAEVIKVEQPLVGDESRSFTPPELGDQCSYFLSSNRNKRSITINLKNEKGRGIIHDLVKESDILIENFRTGYTQRMGVDYESLKQINPGLIYLSISGFGRTGPEKNRAGYDLLLQGYSGLMSTTGEKNKPYKAGPSVVDISTGHLGTIGVLSALLARNKTGKGQFIDCSLLDGQISMLNHLATSYFATGESAQPMGQGHNSIVPYQVFHASDKPFIIAAANDSLWKKTCEALGWNDLLILDEFKTNDLRVKNRNTLIPIISERVINSTSEEICNKLNAVGVPSGPINSVGEAVTSLQSQSRNMIVDIKHPTIGSFKAPNFPLKFSDMKTTVKRYPPLLGEHTDEILNELGYSESNISDFKKKNII